jgi:hypothetical protein
MAVLAKLVLFVDALFLLAYGGLCLWDSHLVVSTIFPSIPSDALPYTETMSKFAGYVRLLFCFQDSCGSELPIFPLRNMHEPVEKFTCQIHLLAWLDLPGSLRA